MHLFGSKFSGYNKKANFESPSTNRRSTTIFAEDEALVWLNVIYGLIANGPKLAFSWNSKSSQLSAPRAVFYRSSAFSWTVFKAETS